MPTAAAAATTRASPTTAISLAFRTRWLALTSRCGNGGSILLRQTGSTKQPDSGTHELLIGYVKRFDFSFQGPSELPRILVVDDEPLISMLVEDWLTDLGCEVVGPARTVRDALALVGNDVLDGAILDIRLGDEESYPIAEALQSRGIPFAFATGQGEFDPNSGFPDPLVLMKPFDFESVQDVLAKLLAGQTRESETEASP